MNTGRNVVGKASVNKMLKVVTDTNIYISAILFGGKPEQVRELARKGKIELLISEATLTEVAGILKRKFSWPDWQISETIEGFRTGTTLVTPKRTLKVIKGHDPDNRILECAIEGKARYIISGDEHHILPLKEYQSIKIVSPATFLREMNL